MLPMIMPKDANISQAVPDEFLSQQYSNNTPVSDGQNILDRFQSGSTTAAIGRGVDELSGNISGSLSGENKIPADEVNQKYAPIGPDGTQQKITDQPQYPEVAQMLGKAKGDQMDIEGRLQRWQYQNPNSGLKNFIRDSAAFVLDPANLATMFVPGLGEAGMIKGLSEVGVSGFAGRTIARGVSGGLSQVPLTAIKYGEGTQWNSDYDARAAFYDLKNAAVMGALFHSGIGAATDAWKGMRSIGKANISDNINPPEANKDLPLPPDAQQIVDSDAITKDGAMRSAVSQVVDNRPVDVEALFPVRAAAYNIMSPEGTLIRPEDKLSDFEHYDTATLTPEQEQARANQQTWLKQWENEKTAQNTKEAEWQRFSYQFDQNMIANKAQQQSALYRDGWSPDMTQTELASASEEFNKPKEEPVEAPIKLPPTHVDAPVLEQTKNTVQSAAQENNVVLDKGTSDFVAQKVAEEKNPAPEEDGVVGAIKGAIGKVVEAVGLKEKPIDTIIHPDDEKISALEQKLDTSKMTVEERQLLAETIDPYKSAKNTYESAIKALADCMGNA